MTVPAGIRSYSDVVTECGAGAREGAEDIGEASGFGEGSQIGRAHV